MKKLLLQYAAYNLWANELLVDYLLRTAPALTEQQNQSSLRDLVATLLCILDEESIWWQRMKMLERITVPSEGGPSELSQVGRDLVQQSRQWYEWVRNANEHVFEHEFIYQLSKRETVKQSVYGALIHLFTSAAYYRGQLVMQLQHFQMPDIPQTSFMLWLRKK